jgi:hypothetical protein
MRLVESRRKKKPGGRRPNWGRNALAGELIRSAAGRSMRCRLPSFGTKLGVFSWLAKTRPISP